MTNVETVEIPTEITDDTTKTIQFEESRGAPKKEAFFRKKEEKFQPFKFERPDAAISPYPRPRRIIKTV